MEILHMAAATTKPPTTSTALARPSVAINSTEELSTIARIMFSGRGQSMANVERWETVACIIMAGMEVGLGPNQALDSIMVSKTGKLTIWGDGALALVRASGLLESHEPETVEGHGDDRHSICRIQRKGEPVREFTFSIEEANKAGLIKRAEGVKGNGPWITYQDRMLKMRARGTALRDVFPDVLRGLTPREEQDDAEATMRVVQVDTPAGSGEPAPATGVSSGESIPDADAVVMVTQDQLKEIAHLKSEFTTAEKLTDPEQAQAAWVAVMADAGVKSAREFTKDQAVAFIEAFGKRVDPFGHPRTANSQAA